ncbi:histone acetyltransferases subunit 3-domain-containing protein [Cyathus striatus]|nr:histone acetyltransferases subunit 3-domain-containing protein [Cyathus striatus]
MSSKLTQYQFPEIRSALLRDVPASIPPIEDLEKLTADLKLLRSRSMDRAKKAGEDLKTLEESMRRMCEKEKGKSRAHDKLLKKERDYTPSIDGDDSARPLSSTIHAKPRTLNHASHSIPSSNRSSVDPRKPTIEDLKKQKNLKKKRKLDDRDSDADHESVRSRKTPPPLPAPTHTPQHVHHPLSSHPLKAQKSTSISAIPHPKSSTGPDFTVPQPTPLLPPRPPTQPTPTPGPSKPIEVTEDFSKIKPPAQILVSTFYTSIEPWIRPIKEEDVGFLEHVGDEVEPFIMPKLGRHYLEQWEEQDAGLLTLGEVAEAPPESYAPPAPKWEPSTLAEGDLLGEDRGHGPLTERVISALLPVPDPTGWKGVKAAEDAMEGRPGGSGAAAARRERLNVLELENRIRDTMRFHGLIDGIPDFTEKVDDPIATALRHAQSQLRTVLATNKVRKSRLTAIARDRLGHQEYLELRDSIDRNITTLYARLQKKDAPRVNKKKKKEPSSSGSVSANGGGSANGGVPVDPPCPAALGLGPDEENRLVVSDQLKQLVATRREWVDSVGKVFEEKQEESPGRVWGLPKESVFVGVEEEVARLLEGGWGLGNRGGGGGASGSGSGGKREVNGVGPAYKGKERERGNGGTNTEDAMDIG